MDAILKKIERLDDEVSHLKEEVIRTRLEVVRLEKDQKENHKKIGELSHLKEDVVQNRLEVVRLDKDQKENHKKIGELSHLKKEVIQNRLEVVRLEKDRKENHKKIGELSHLKEEVVQNRLEVVRLEKNLKENHKKIADVEQKQATPPVCQCQCQSQHNINDTKELKRKFTVFEKEFNDVKSKSGNLSKLQVLLNSALLKCQKSNEVDCQIGELQQDLKKLCQDMTDCQLALGDRQQEGAMATLSHEKKASIPPYVQVYHFRECRNITILHDLGIFKYRHTNWLTSRGILISRQPLTPDCASFSVELRHPCGDTVIGLWSSKLGELHTCYLTRIGRIIDVSSNLSNYSNAPICGGGDTIMCRLNFHANTFEILQNSSVVYKSQRINPDQLHPYIVMNVVTEIKALETEPWRR